MPHRVLIVSVTLLAIFSTCIGQSKHARSVLEEKKK